MQSLDTGNYLLNLSQLNQLVPIRNGHNGALKKTITIQLIGVTEEQEEKFRKLAITNHQFIAFLQEGNVQGAAKLIYDNMEMLFDLFLNQAQQCLQEPIPSHFTQIMERLGLSPKAALCKELSLQWMESAYSSAQSDKVTRALCEVYFNQDNNDALARLDTIFSKIALIGRENQPYDTGHSQFFVNLRMGDFEAANGFCVSRQCSVERVQRLIHLGMESALRTPKSSLFFGTCIDIALAWGFEPKRPLLREAYNNPCVNDVDLTYTLCINLKVLQLGSKSFASSLSQLHKNDPLALDTIKFLYTGELDPNGDFLGLAKFAHTYRIASLTKKIQEILFENRSLGLLTAITEDLGENDPTWPNATEKTVQATLQRCTPETIHIAINHWGRYLTTLDLNNLAGQEDEVLRNHQRHLGQVERVTLTPNSTGVTLTLLQRLPKWQALVVGPTFKNTQELSFSHLSDLFNLKALEIYSISMIEQFIVAPQAISKLNQLKKLILSPEEPLKTTSKLPHIHSSVPLEYLEIRCWSEGNLTELFLSPLGHLRLLKLTFPKSVVKNPQEFTKFVQSAFLAKLAFMHRLETLCLEAPLDNLSVTQVKEFFVARSLESIQINDKHYTRSP